MIYFFILFLSYGNLNSSYADSSADSSVDLHAHLFMKEGLKGLFTGDFSGPLAAQSWKDRFSSQTNPETLEKSGNAITVVALYAHPLFVGSLRDSIRKQILLAEDFVKENPHWIIARNAKQANEALKGGKKILILSLEGASGILETEEDLSEFIDEKGIRIVTLLHFTEDRFGAPAFLKGFAAWASPQSLIRNFFKGVFRSSENPVRRNDRGLTVEGKKLAKALIDRGVWIDLTHASDTAQNDLISLMTAAGHPLLYTHTSLRDYFRAERAVSRPQLEAVQRSGGIVGIMPSEQMLEGTPIPDSACLCHAPCEGGLEALVIQYNKMSEILKTPSNIAMGTDFNGGIPHLKPSCKTGTSLDQEGLWNIGQMKDLWKAMKTAGAHLPKYQDQSVKTFLSAWERVLP